MQVLYFQLSFKLDVRTDLQGYNHMVTLLENRETDVVLADLSYSRAREETIDFSAPFMNLGIGFI